MLLKKTIQNPILMIGILCMIIFIYFLNDKGYLNTKGKFTATSCKSTLIMLDKRIPANWATKCAWTTCPEKKVCKDGKCHKCEPSPNILEVTIDENSSVINTKDIIKVKQILYRQLANNLVFIAKNSPIDSVENIFQIVVLINTSKMDIWASTDGPKILPLRTLQNSQTISEHLKRSIVVKENIK